jgi:hypothetical protein
MWADVRAAAMLGASESDNGSGAPKITTEVEGAPTAVLAASTGIATGEPA